MFANLVLRSAEYLFERPVGIKANGAGNGKEFDEIDPTLPRLKAGDPGLILPQPLRKIALPQFGVLPLADQKAHKRPMLLAADGLHCR